LHPFAHSLSGIAVGLKDRIYALGDGEVRIFEPNGELLRQWKAPENSLCLAVDSGERIYIGTLGRVDIFNSTGGLLKGFTVGESARPALVTAIKTFGREILVADATARYIRRYDAGGKQIGEIGTQNKTRSFMLPNRSLDLAVDARGTICATDTGRHRVTSWKLDGSPLGYFGKFGLSRPEDFVGCCNPVNIALAPDGNIVTAEKVVARVKVFDPNGKLLALIGQEHFDQNCEHLYLAVDSKKRIVVADPVRREVKVFSPNSQPGGPRSV
jgi:sugar lactone lactonase YvrE